MVAAAQVETAAAPAPTPSLSRTCRERTDSVSSQSDQKAFGACESVDSVDLSTADGSSEGSAPNSPDWSRFDSDSAASSVESTSPRRRCAGRSLQVFFQSGMLSAVGFLVGMLIYDAAVPVDYLGFEVAVSWLYFWGAVTFILEAVIEIVYALKFPAERLPELRKRDSVTAWDRFRSVDWEFWTGVWFMIPSIFYLAEALVDPNIVGPRPAKALNMVGIDDTKFVTVCDWLGVSLYLLDAIVRWFAHLSVDSELDAGDKLVRFKVWTASSISSFDWAFWGDVLFIGAAVLGLFVKLYSNLALSAISSGLWTLDVVLYLVAAILVWRKCGDDVPAEAAIV